MREPIIHSHITDVLPGDHPWAHENVCCNKCGRLVHAFNNECMTTWVETGEGPKCFACFFWEAGETLNEGLGLPDA